MSSEELDACERATRERLEADVRYNEALTALDSAIVATTQDPTPGREQLERLLTALIVFLQQITAFIDTKDREAAAVSSGKFDAIDRELRSLQELRTQVTVLGRGMRAMERAVANPLSSVAGPQSSDVSSPPPPVSDDYKYVGFEDQFRGSDEAIEERLRGYVPLFAGRSDVLDVGCGRGEFLATLKASGISARGVDANSEMAALARERGLEAVHADALAYLSSLADASLGGIIATQVVEHLEPSYLMQLLDTMARKLRQGAPVVIETINPACWFAFFSSYIRDLSHVRPVHPDTLQYLLRANGFEQVEVRYSAPMPDHAKMQTIDLPAAVRESTDTLAAALTRVAHTVNANAVMLNNLMFTYLDYAAVGYRA